VYFVNSYITVAVYLAVFIGAFIAVLRWRERLAVTSRLQRMMLCCGISEDAALRADQVQRLDMDAVRSRCRNCPVTDLCGRWLDGESIATNSFCPNAWHFAAAASSDQPAANSGYIRRWITGPR